MVNVVFNGSTAGNLLITAEPTTGDRIQIKDVFCFEWAFDIGHLNEGIDSKYRIELPDRLILGDYDPAGLKFKTGTDYTETGKSNLRNWSALKTRLTSGEAVRVWYGDAPHSLCGFYHLCTLLREYSCDCYVMKAPRVSGSDDSVTLVNSWGAFASERIGDFFHLQRKLDQREIRLYAAHWETLVQENAPLRASISGVPTSVQEDFYDMFIKQQIPDEPFKEAVLIGSVLAAYHLSIYSYWLEYRIQKMIDAGALTVLETPDRDSSHRILQRGDFA